MDKNVRIRVAVRDDVGTILRFIRELAVYERLSDQCIAEEDQLAESLFGERKSAEVLLADIDDKPVAFALFFHNYSTFLAKPGLYLEDLFVEPEFRGFGVGKALLRELAKIAVDRGCGRMEWWVLDWNEPAIEFYKSLGADPMSDWTVFRLSGESLKSLADG